MSLDRSLFIAGVMALASLAGTAEGKQLLSIQHIDLAPNQSIFDISIVSWGIRVRAVCHIPLGWVVSAGSMGSTGSMGGNSDEGQLVLANGRLQKSELGELNALFLIDDPTPQKAELSKHPFNFVGGVSIATFANGKWVYRERKIDNVSFVLTPAEKCPGPD